MIFGEGIPVGWLITNEEDTGSLTHFFHCLYAQTGSITPNTFMSDDAHRISELNKRHRASSELEPEKVSDEKWMVCSQNTPNKTYSIIHELKSCKCFLRCGFCDVCVHMYTCTCMDYSLHSTACKHIHAVHRLDSNKASTSAEPVNEEISLNDVVSDDNYLCRVCRDPSNTSESLLHVKQEQLHSKLSELDGMVSSCTDMDVLKTAMKHICSAVSVIKTSETTSHCTTDLVTRKRPAPNALYEKQ